MGSHPPNPPLPTNADPSTRTMPPSSSRSPLIDYRCFPLSLSPPLLPSLQLQQASSRLQNKLGRELTRRETTLLDLQLTWLQDANAASFDTDGSMSRSSSSRSSSRSSVTTSNDLDHPADLCSTLDSSTSPECQSHPTCGIGLHLIDNYVIDPRSSDMDSIETSAASGHEDYMVQYFSCVEDVSRRDQKTDAVSQPEGGSTPGFLSFLSRLFYNNLRSSCGSSPA